MAAESGSRVARRRFTQLTGEEGGTGGAEGLPAFTPWLGAQVPGKAGLPVRLSAFRSEESRLLETISIFIFLGNFTAFISGKIKAVIAGEMIPIRA